MAVIEKSPDSARISGSFRDPSGYVFKREGRIFRAINSECGALFREISDSGLLSKLIEKQLVVRTWFVERELERDLASEHPGFQNFLEHEVVPTISYPYEWSFSMLADAALHTLELQKNLVGEGFSLKDATAYNIQFVEGRPIFVDLASIERPARMNLWFALGQFSQMFTFPLHLCRYHGWDLRSYFLGSIGGRDLDQVAASFGKLEKWLPGNLFEIALPLMFQRNANSNESQSQTGRQKSNADPRAQLFTLDRLTSRINKLAAGYKPRGIWTDYTKTCSYDDEAEQAKKRLVREFLEEVKPRRVLDIGCNTGDYSYIAANAGASVIAADLDPTAIEGLYRRLKNEPSDIAPMVIDLSNPSPAIGYLNVERPSFFNRVDVDCVLALALMHHLHVTGNLSVAAIRDMFATMTRQHLVIEYVPTDDNMFQKLMRFRVDLYGGLSLPLFKDTFEERFRLIREERIPNTQRTLLLMSKDGS